MKQILEYIILLCRGLSNLNRTDRARLNVIYLEMSNPPPPTNLFHKLPKELKGLHTKTGKDAGPISSTSPNEIGTAFLPATSTQQQSPIAGGDIYTPSALRADVRTKDPSYKSPRLSDRPEHAINVLVSFREANDLEW